MKEVVGDMWKYHDDPNFYLCITTNGFVKKNGECTMGRGCALEAKLRHPDIAKELGELITYNGNKVWRLEHRLMSFPVKHKWWEQADLKLIAESTNRLLALATAYRKITFILPRPGCGNGHLKWEDVKPLLVGLPDNVWVISRG